MTTNTLVHILYPTDTIHTVGKSAVINKVPVSARPSGADPLLGLTIDVFL